jgi:hypothetical protein
MDHPDHYPRFIAWLEALSAEGVRIENPVGLVRWNLEKRYLQSLSDEGVPIVPTRYVFRDDPVDLEALFQRFGELVVKPCLSAAAKDAFRLASLEDMKSFLAGEPPHALPFGCPRSGRDFMVQPFQQEILTKGEWSLIFLNGRFSQGIET